MISKNKLVCGVGINDADYSISKYEVKYTNGIKTKKRVWICPYYKRWSQILSRCYSEKFQDIHPYYKGCTVSEEWKVFSNFRLWITKAEESLPEGINLEDVEVDKDIKSNFSTKIYSEDTCTLVHPKVNSFLKGVGSLNQQMLPAGVSQPKDHNSKRFTATITNCMTGKCEYLGAFSSPEDAHNAWASEKLKYLSILKESGLLWDSQIERMIRYRLLNFYS